MQFTNNFKDRHKNGEFGWLFTNVNQRINDKVNKSGTGLKCFQGWRKVNKAEYKATISDLRKAKSTLLKIGLCVTLKKFPFEL